LLKIVEQICQAIRDAATILVSTHERPDGDALGSELALLEIAHHLGKTAEVVNPSPVPHIYQFLPLADRVRRTPRRSRNPDLAIVLDAPHLGRVRDIRPSFDRARRSINIDHHDGNDHFASINWVDTTASATGQMLLPVVEHLGTVTTTIATNLYVTLLTDTGRFTYSNTTADCFRVAARLVSFGADPNAIARQLYQNNTPEMLRIAAKALASLKLYDNDRIAVISLRHGDFTRIGVSPIDTQDFAEVPRDIEGVRVGVFIREESPESFKVSLRANPGVNVADIARVFGGGGHPLAAGCVLQGSLVNVRNALLREIRRATRPSSC